MLRVAIYARVSDKKQRDSHTIASQLRRLPEYCKRKGWAVAGTYVDDGRSAKAGVLHKRLDFARFRADMAAGKFDIVLVVAFDRLTRTDDLGEAGDILGSIQRAKVKLAIAMSDLLLDLNTSQGQMVVSHLAWAAAEENRVRRDRAERSRESSYLKGTPAARTPYGLKWSKRDSWQIDEKEAEPILRGVAMMLDENISAAAAGRALDKLGCYKPPGLQRGYRWTTKRACWAIALGQLLRNPVYRGEFRAVKGKPPIPVPQILDPATWARVRERMTAAKKGSADRTRHEYLVAKLATCARCGERLEVRSAEKRPGNRQDAPARYNCPRRRNRYGLYKEHESCDAPLVKTAEVDDRVWAMMCSLFEKDSILARARDQAAERAEDAAQWARAATKAKAELAELDKMREALVHQAGKGLIPAELLGSALDSQERKRKMLNSTIEAAGIQVADVATMRTSLDAARASVVKHQGRLNKVPFEERRALVLLVFRVIKVNQADGQLRVDITGNIPKEREDLVATSACRSKDESPQDNASDYVRFRLIA